MTTRLGELVDEGSFREHDVDLAPTDPLGFPGYDDALRAAPRRTESSESVVVGSGRIGGRDIEIALFDFDFLGGSMGEVAGERLARALERSAQTQHPFVLRTSTGGARMQEGMRSLVQMPKVVAARLQLAASGTPFVAVLGHPTTGGVLASLGSLADITIAEADATIGFAWPRVAEAFTGEKLSGDSHTADSAVARGLVDAIAESSDLRMLIEDVLSVLDPDQPESAPPPDRLTGATGTDEWDVVLAARRNDRLNAATSLTEICDRAFELRGDRSGCDDRALVAALARIAGRKALVLALDRNLFPAAGAFRKAHRCIEIAGRLRIPLVTLIDTRGADPSEKSESAGVASAIAQLFEAMLLAPVPIVCVVTGEGGSGGALAFATGDVLAAYAGSFFSVIGPEGAAQILWRNTERAPEAARALKLSAPDLARLGIADEVVAEPLTDQSLRQVVAYHLDQLGNSAPREQLARRRQSRWRSR